MTVEVLGGEPAEAVVVEVVGGSTNDVEASGQLAGRQQAGQGRQQEAGGEIAGRPEQRQARDRLGLHLHHATTGRGPSSCRTRRFRSWTTPVRSLAAGEEGRNRYAMTV